MHRATFLDELHKDLKEKGVVVRKQQSKIIMNTFFDTLFNVISRGQYLTIADFGVFESKLRTFQNFGNEKEPVERWQITFKPAPKMKKRINGSLKKS